MVKLLATSLGEVWDFPMKVIHSFSAVNSFDRPPQLCTVGPVVYVLNEFSPLSYFVIRCRFGNLDCARLTRLHKKLDRLDVGPGWTS